MRTLIYTTVKEQFKGNDIAISLRGPKDTASVRVVEFWQGETEKCDVVITDHEGVSAAYKKVGTEVKPFTTAKKVEATVAHPQAPVEVVEPTEAPTEEPVRRMGRPRKEV